MTHISDSENAELRQLLNDQQYDAVCYCDGPSMIVAGAGSGKTRVLTYKIAYLLMNGYSASSVLALTFTNKAAREMKERIASVVGSSIAKWLWMGTFHSVFLRILQKEPTAVGYQPGFTIYDSDDAKSLVKSLIKELQLDEKVYTPRNVAGRISTCKNNLISPAAYDAQPDLLREDVHRGQGRFAELYATYCERCRQANAMDFDDLLFYTYQLFKNNEAILERYQKQFAYILVDEYQDTNKVQHRIVSLLAAKHERICVVGDDAQSIYSFRGANIDNILQFERSYKNCRIFKLEQNYRSTQTIVDAANSLIKKNQFQIPKKVFSELSVGEPMPVLSNVSDFEEGFAVASEIGTIIATKEADYSDVAVLYRTNAQSRIIEEALRKRNFPYKIYGGHSFYQRKEIKDALAYMRLVINPNDEESLKRIINFPARGIGATTMQKVLVTAHREHISVLDLIERIDSVAIDLNRGTTAKLRGFAETIAAMRLYNETHDAYESAEKILMDSGIIADVSSTDDPENLSRKENIFELLSAIHEFCEQKVNEGDNEVQLLNFLSEVSLLTDQDSDTEEDKNKITLMTVHASKGLEFAYVFIVGLEEELFPSVMCETERDLEEERRLFYVAITRAKKRCTLSYAKSRFRNGQTQYQMPSRFLDDIDKQYLKMPAVYTPKNEKLFGRSSSDDAADNTHFPTFRKRPETSFKPTTQGNFKPLTQVSRQNNSAATSATSSLSAGDRVAHKTFGDGRVVGIEGTAENAKARIDFGEQGERVLLLKYAQLTKID